MKKMTTRLYACGGTGINIGQMSNSPHITKCYIDASDSNRGQDLDESKIYRVKAPDTEIDGSGGLRSKNYAAIVKSLPDILDKFAPADFNIILYGNAGGTGSVAGPVLHRELLRQGKTVISVVVGASDNTRAAENQFNTMNGLEVMAANNRLPVIVYYTTNLSSIPESEIDREVLFVLDALGELSSQDNERMDTADVYNWARYHEVCSAHPQLSALSIFDNRKEAAAVVEPVSVASLWPDNTVDQPFGNPMYSTKGYPRKPMDFAEQLHFVISNVKMDDILTNIKDAKTKLEQVQASYRRSVTRIDMDDQVTDNDMIL